jgi:hypothetical protein
MCVVLFWLPCHENDLVTTRTFQGQCVNIRSLFSVLHFLRLLDGVAPSTVLFVCRPLLLFTGLIPPSLEHVTIIRIYRRLPCSLSRFCGSPRCSTAAA